MAHADENFLNDQTPIVIDNRRDPMLVFQICPQRNKETGFVKKCFLPLFLVTLFCVSLVGGIAIGMFTLPPVVHEEIQNHCDKLRAPSHINQSTSYCEDPLNGNISLEPSVEVIGLSIYTTCYMNCNDGYEMEGQVVMDCLKSGSWSHKVLKCHANVPPSCPYLEVLQKGTTSCNKGDMVGSVCNFECDQGLQLAGEKRTTCLSNLSWSNPIPLCAPLSCPRCSCGPGCRFTNQWTKVFAEVPTKPWGQSVVIYAGFEIHCHINHHRGFNIRWDCTCTDVSTQTGKKCHGFKKEEDACGHALANLITDLEKENKYPAPCDLSAMQPYLSCG